MKGIRKDLLYPLHPLHPCQIIQLSPETFIFQYFFPCVLFVRCIPWLWRNVNHGICRKIFRRNRRKIPRQHAAPPEISIFCVSGPAV